MANEPELLGASTSISDGEVLDWAQLERTAPSERERRILRQLQIVSEIARWHASDVGNDLDAGAGERTIATAAIAAATSPVTSPMPERWGHLELRQRVGVGAFGEVYRAWDTTLQREVALKLMLEDGALGRSGAAANAALEEARLMARVRHPNVVQVYGAERHDGRVGLWMEFVRGRTLDEQVRAHGTMGAREAALLGQELCRALTAVHRAGLVHRDVKARNVMREDGGRIVLMDFGTGWDREPASGVKARLAGTPAFMAPEVLNGAPATPQSDLYSLGVLLHYVVTGQFPVEARSIAEMRQAHAEGRVSLLREARPDLPEPFLQVVEKALITDPGQRFGSSGQMERALGAALGVEPAAHAEPAGNAPKTDGGSKRQMLAVVLWSVVALAVVLGGQFGARWRRHEPRQAATAEPSNVAPQSGAGAAATPYTVEAHFARRRNGTSEPLQPGGRVRPGDGLALEFSATRPLYVYVVNEDEQGEAYLLFPLNGVQPLNPLPAGVQHSLPGTRGGKRIDWQVSSAGGKEHLLLVASPERLDDFEAELMAVPQAEAGEQYAHLSSGAKTRLRGIGGLQERSEAETPAAASHRLFDLAARLAARSEVVQGVWVRQVEFDNPRQTKE